MTELEHPPVDCLLFLGGHSWFVQQGDQFFVFSTVGLESEQNQ